MVVGSFPLKMLHHGCLLWSIGQNKGPRWLGKLPAVFIRETKKLCRN